MSGAFGRRNMNTGATAAATARGRPAATDTSSIPEAPAYRRDPVKALRDSLIVLAFMGYLAVQTYTGFLYEVLGGIRPRAAVALDDLIHFLLVSHIGVTAASAVLAALAVGLALLVFIRGSKRPA